MNCPVCGNGGWMYAYLSKQDEKIVIEIHCKETDCPGMWKIETDEKNFVRQTT